MKTIDEIRKIRDMVVYAHSTRVAEQLTDQSFYEDEFKTSVKEPFHVVRTGAGSQLVDAIVNHILASTPKVFREPRRNTDKERNSCLKVSKMLNHWVMLLSDEIEEAVKNMVLRGDGIFHIQYNPDYKDNLHNCLPVLITAPDPLYVFTMPYDAMRPSVVVKKFLTDCINLKLQYPEWAANGNEKVEYSVYFDEECRYAEAGSSPLYADGVIENFPTGVIPFVHMHSGFGKKSPDGKPEDLAVGRLRKVRGRLIEQCNMESRIDSIIGLYANPILQISQMEKDAEVAGREELQKTALGPGSTVVVPYGWQQTIYVPNVPSAQLFAHLNQINQALEFENPPVMSGVQSGTSGRQEDVLYESVRKRYSRLVNNLCKGLSEALSIGLSLLYNTPGALPVTVRATEIKGGVSVKSEEQVTKEDIDGYFDCEVILNPDELLEKDRKIMLGRVLVNERRISHREFLIDYMGKTEDEADETLAEVLVEDAIMNNEALKMLRVQEAMEKMGAAKYSQQAQADTQSQVDVEQAVRSNPGIMPRPSEATNPVARDTIRQALQETPVGSRSFPSMLGGANETGA